MRATLQTRLMVTFFLVVAMLTGFAFLVLAHARNTADVYQRSLSDLLRVAELTESVDQGARLLGRLATDPTPGRAAEEFQRQKERIHQLRRNLPEQTVSPAGARMVQDLDSMTDSFLVEAGAAIYAFRSGDLELYFRHDREAATIVGYVRDTADRLLAAELDAYNRAYPEVIRRDRELQQTNRLLLAAIALVAVVFAWSFARGVTSPLRSLAAAASRIAGGELEGPPVPQGQGQELEILGGAFNHMQENLRRHVAELKEKAELEHRLQAEELENLQVHSLLREAELRALQSQVHPHFLFNTLNMVAKMALIEGADQTRRLIETVADLLRYSLRQLDRPVTLRDEVEQARRYMTIQSVRFRERFRFDLELDEAVLETPIPCLTLQPLVENGLIHGIGSREQGGSIHLAVVQAGDRVRVTVADDGVGIAPDRMKLLNEGGDPVVGGRGDTTGLGLQNVRRRLELFYGEQVGFSIQSRPGSGTMITLLLPESSRGVRADADPGGR